MTTIHDVARRAGVSSVTVSRVLNGASSVSQSTRAKVEQAIKELGYLPNLAARSLRSRQTSTIALIVPDITNTFWTTVARGVEDAAQEQGYSVLLGNSDENRAKQQGYVNAVLQQRVDGVIIAPYDADPRNLQSFGEQKTPVVVIDRLVDGWKGDTVRSDSVSGAFALTQHLLSLGHRRIAIISGPHTTSTADERVAGYCLALEDAGVPVDLRLIRRGEYRARSGRAQVEALFQEHLDPTAVVAANNVLAMGILEGLQARGLTVPRDVALVAFDDLPDLTRFFPFLTVVVQPAYDMGLNAAQLLLSRINASEPMSPRQVVLPSRLVLRYSCGRFLHNPDVTGATLMPFEGQTETRLIKPVGTELLQRLDHIPGLSFPLLSRAEVNTQLERADVERLQRALSFKPVDRLPYLEPHVTSKAVLEFVLERSLTYTQADLDAGNQSPTPAELVEFAERTGMDAVACEMNWLPDPLAKQTSLGDLLKIRGALPPLSLTEPLSRLENYLRAVQGKRIGVYVSLRSFLGQAMRLAGEQRQPEEIERLMDALLDRQEKVLRAVCDRFSPDLLFVLAQDDFQVETVEQRRLFERMVLPCLSRLIAPAREHDLLAGISLPGPVQAILPALAETGFGLFHALDPERDDQAAVCSQWSGRMVLSGGLSTRLLCFGTPEEVETSARAVFALTAGQSGFVFSSSEGITGAVRPENFLTLVRALHRYGVYRSMGSLEKL